jgi:hypothetical protein
LDRRDLFQESAIALEALGETTNGDADSVVMNPAFQLPKFFEAQPTANSAGEKSGLPCPGAEQIAVLPRAHAKMDSVHSQASAARVPAKKA